MTLVKNLSRMVLAVTTCIDDDRCVAVTAGDGLHPGPAPVKAPSTLADLGCAASGGAMVQRQLDRA